MRGQVKQGVDRFGSLVEVRLRAHAFLVYAFLYIPIVVVVFYSFNGTDRLTVTDYAVPDVIRRMFNFGGAGSNVYNGYDRFGRLAKNVWYDYTSGDVQLDSIDYVYDSAGNRLTRDIIDDPRTIAIVAATDDGTLIGYATAHATYETGHAERGLYVADLYVAPGHRRQGVARALLAAAARRGHAIGARHLWLTAQEKNAAAHAFYRRLGARGETVRAFAVVHQDFNNLAAEPPP